MLISLENRQFATHTPVAAKLHREIFPNCVIADDINSVIRFGLTAGGVYIAAGAGGTITGRGGNVILIDDPIKGAENAASPAYRRALQTWFESVLYPRLEPGGAIVLIQTRWHHDDLAGWLLREHASEGWRVVSLPAIAEPHDLLLAPEKDDPELGKDPQRSNDFNYKKDDPHGYAVRSVRTSAA